MNKEEINKLNEAIEHCEDVISNLKLKENCDECLKQHEQLKEWLEDYKFIKEKIEWLKEEMTEPAFNLVFSTQEFLHNWYKGIQMYSAENDVLKRKVSEYENPQPYKFEDLNSDMWVWDNDIKEVIHIRSVVDDDLYFLSVGEEDVGYAKFEEERFFPVTKAMEYQK